MSLPTTTLVGHAVGDLAALKPEHAAAVEANSRPILSANSEKLYAAFVNRFMGWREQHGYPDTLPASVEHTIAWLSDLASAGTAPSSISVALAALRWFHLQAGQPFDARDVRIGNTLKRIRRERVTEPAQAAALTPNVLRDILASTGDDLFQQRDAAMLALAYVFALRRSELVAIDLEVFGNGDAVLRLTPEAAHLTLRRSKTSQDAVETVSIPRDANPRALGAIERWIRSAKIDIGTPILRQITPHGAVSLERIAADCATRAIQRRIATYYVSTGMAEPDAIREGKKFSGHSGRVGVVVAAVENGARHEDIAKVTRHRSGSRMIAHYGKTADQLRTAPHKIRSVGL